jgi:hypothetical protein
LSLAEIVTIADDLGRMASRISRDAREVLTDMLEQMETLADTTNIAAQEAYRRARRDLESEWLTAETVLDDMTNECNRSLNGFVTQAEFHVRRFEKELQKQVALDDIRSQRADPLNSKDDQRGN